MSIMLYSSMTPVSADLIAFLTCQQRLHLAARSNTIVGILDHETIPSLFLTHTLSKVSQN